MRTTIDFEDTLLHQLKQVTVQEHMTVSRFVEMAVQEKLARKYGESRGDTPPLPIWRGQGLMPGIDLNDGRALQDILDGR